MAVNAYASESGQEAEVEESGEGEDEEQQVFSIDVEDYVLYLKGIKGTRFSVLLVSEKEYPLDVIRLKLKNLSEAFEELSKFEYVEQE